MRSLLIIFSILVVFSGCVRKNKVPTAQNPTSTASASMHEVVVAEVIQTSKYTYLKVSENNTENWIAVSRQEASAGETYFYNQAMEMKNFNSKELDRTFENIYFVQKISKQPIVGDVQTPAGHQGKAEGSRKEGVAVAPAEGSVSIAQLYAAKADYSGKIIKMKGQVVKINEEVMGKNWIHIQDGTGDLNTADLTITTLDQVKVDDLVTFEGTITLDKDFGYGYFYALLMEDAKLVK